MRLSRKFWIILVIVVIVVIAAGVGATVLRRPAATVVPAATRSGPMAIELLQSDVTTVRSRDLRQVLPLSGALRAVNQAAVKARVAGEVREVLVREGEAVTQGQILARMDGTEYLARSAQTKGALLAARGQLDIATKARDNNRALLGKGFISQNAFDNAASQYEIAQANVDSAKAALDVTQKSLSDTVVRAPLAGLVSNRTVQPGEKVSIDFHLLDVVDLRRMEMEAAVPTGDIQRVALGQEVQVRIEGLTKPIIGKVARINPSTQAGSRSIIVYVTIDNPDGLLRVGMFGEAQLTLVKRSAVLSLPTSAIQTVGGAAFAYAIENGVLVQKPLTLGITGDDGEGGAVEVTAGLVEGARIVRNNLGTLLPGTPVVFAATATASSVPKAAAVVPSAAAPTAPR
ncbi:MAG: efflux RND transporter periplasmic adaptor subunit [Herminiimonas sp.]|nr:efflux RND transporter periplasmic adaptor subunit [Herminiimonas sp.]